MAKMIVSVTIDMEVVEALMEKKRREGLVISNYVEGLLRRDLGLPPLRYEELVEGEAEPRDEPHP